MWQMNRDYQFFKEVTNLQICSFLVMQLSYFNSDILGFLLGGGVVKWFQDNLHKYERKGKICNTVWGTGEHLLCYLYMAARLNNKAIAVMCLAHLRAFRLMEANIYRHLPTKFGYNQMQGWKVINRYRILQVNFHIWPHLTFDLLMWPLTPEYHRGQYRASINQVWLQTDAGLESYQPL